MDVVRWCWAVWVGVRCLAVSGIRLVLKIMATSFDAACTTQIRGVLSRPRRWSGWLCWLGGVEDVNAAECEGCLNFSFDAACTTLSTVKEVDDVILPSRRSSRAVR